jgi:hypothetical protein
MHTVHTLHGVGPRFHLLPGHNLRPAFSKLSNKRSSEARSMLQGYRTKHAVFLAVFRLQAMLSSTSSFGMPVHDCL